MHELRIISPEGDTKLEWAEVDTAECQEAQRQFEHMIQLGYMLAYRVAEGDKPAEQIDRFDPYAERIIMTPMISGG